MDPDVGAARAAAVGTGAAAASELIITSRRWRRGGAVERRHSNSGVDDARATTKTQVRSYFGEKIAFYYLFLAHATTYFSYGAVIGFAVFLNTLISPQAENAASVPYFCAY